MNPDRRYTIKLYIGDDLKRCRAVLFKDLTWEQAEEHYERINVALGHNRDADGELIVLSSNRPYVLVDD